MPELPPLDELLACPVDGSPLVRTGDEWVSAAGRRYPTVQGIPVLFHPDANNSIDAMAVSRSSSNLSDDALRLDTLGLSPEHRQQIGNAARAHPDGKVDAVVSEMIAATCGNLYLHLVGKLPRHPIPHLRMKGSGLLLDIGCNWGRWSMAAAQAGFAPVGIDPQLGAVLAAKRVAAKMGREAHFVCGDARYLPFRPALFDAVFSYSVLQHLSEDDVGLVLDSAARIMKRDSVMLVQMPNGAGLRNLFQQARRGFRRPQGFEVRYWTIDSLRRVFGSKVGPVTLSTDCFFGIGLQPADMDLMHWSGRAVIGASEFLRQFPFLMPLADSIYVRCQRSAPR